MGIKKLISEIQFYPAYNLLIVYYKKITVFFYCLLKLTLFKDTANSYYNMVISLNKTRIFIHKFMYIKIFCYVGILILTI